MRSRTVSTCIVALGLLSACRDSAGPAPTDLRELGTGELPRVIDPELFSADLKVSPTSTRLDQELNSYSEKRLVSIRVEGMISATHIYPANNKQFGPHGWAQCAYGAVQIFYGNSVALGPLCYPGNEVLSVMETTLGPVTVIGQGRAVRGEAWTSGYGYTYSGAQQVRVTLVPVPIKLTAEWTYSPVAARNTFTVSFPTVPAGATTYETTDWSFVTESGTTIDLTGECGNGTTCSPLISAPGTMSVTGVSNGRSQVDAISVHAGAPRVQVSAQPSSGPRGTTSLIQAVPIPTSAGQSGSFEVIGWWWEPTGSVIGPDPSCAAGEASCSKAVHESGLINVRARVNGVECTGKAYIGR